MKFKIVSYLIGVVLLIGAVLIAKMFIASKKDPEKIEVKPVVKTVSVREVINDTLPLTVEVTGKLVAANKIEIFSEVGGKLLPQATTFKDGNAFQKGEVLLSIDASEFKNSLISARSNLLLALTNALADLKLDYSNNAAAWEQYIANFSIEKMLAPLPETQSAQEKAFITSKNIYTQFYTIKSQEERLEKYTVFAPFNGVVSNSMVNSGTLIRVGQKVGDFINTSDFELEATVNVADIQFLSKGNPVELYSPQLSKTWNGTIKRISESVDRATQSVKVFIALGGPNLRDGLFLNASISGADIYNCIELKRSYLFDGNKVFTVENNKLKVTEVEVVRLNEQTAFIKGLPNGTSLVNEVLIGAYNGMDVNIRKNS